MQRGLLLLTNQEAKELLVNIKMESFSNTPLANKLGSIDLTLPTVEILVSEDEIEHIMDEIGPVDSQTNPTLSSAMNKIMELMNSFRSQNTI